MKKEIKITEENYEDYIQLYKKKDGIEKNATQIFRTVYYGIIILLGLPSSALSQLPINEILKFIFAFVMGVGLGVGIDIGKKHYKRKKNAQLKEEFPNIDTEIETIELEIALEKVNIITLEPVFGRILNHRYVRRYQTNIDTEVFLKHLEESKEKKNDEIKKEMTTFKCEASYINKFVRGVSDLSPDSVDCLMQTIVETQKTKVTKEQLEKIKEIIKCEEIKRQMLEEYRRNYSRLKYETSISKEELEKVKGKILKKSKHLS